jgi:hypothetical protein
VKDEKDDSASLLRVDPSASASTEALPIVEVGDVVVSKFGNRWIVEAKAVTNPEPVYVLRNRPEECPDANGTVFGGAFPQWADRIERKGVRVWQRPTPKCQCPSYANAKGPYPSGFCPECGQWYPGIDRVTALARGHITGGGDTKRECSCVGFCKGRDGLSNSYRCALDGKRGKVGSVSRLQQEHAATAGRSAAQK